jgi:hypothetical protein
MNLGPLPLQEPQGTMKMPGHDQQLVTGDASFAKDDIDAVTDQNGEQVVAILRIDYDASTHFSPPIVRGKPPYQRRETCPRHYTWGIESRAVFSAMMRTRHSYRHKKEKRQPELMFSTGLMEAVVLGFEPSFLASTSEGDDTGLTMQNI